MKNPISNKISILNAPAICLCVAVFLTACSDPQPNETSDASSEKETKQKIEEVVDVEKKSPATVIIEEKSIQSEASSNTNTDIKQKIEEVKQVVVESTGKVVDVTKEASKEILSKSTEVAKDIGKEAISQLQEVSGDATAVAKDVAEKSLDEVEKAAGVVTSVVSEAIKNTDSEKVKSVIDQGAEAAKVVSEKAINKVQELLPKN